MTKVSSILVTSIVLGACLLFEGKAFVPASQEPRRRQIAKFQDPFQLLTSHSAAKLPIERPLPLKKPSKEAPLETLELSYGEQSRLYRRGKSH